VPGGAVDLLAQQIGVADVLGVFADHGDQDPAQRDRLAARRLDAGLVQRGGIGHDPARPVTLVVPHGEGLIHIAAEVLEVLGARGMRRLAAVARGGEAHTDADLAPPVALVLGNEAAGLPEGLWSSVDGRVTVPMAGMAESLNVSMAAAVLCFEVARRRSSLPAVEGAR